MDDQRPHDVSEQTPSLTKAVIGLLLLIAVIVAGIVVLSRLSDEAKSERNPSRSPGPTRNTSLDDVNRVVLSHKKAFPPAGSGPQVVDLARLQVETVHHLP